MLKKLVLLVFLFAFVLSGTSYAWQWGSGWNEGDLNMQKYSIIGDNSEGLSFDSDNDNVDEIIFEADGTVTIGEYNLPATDGSVGQALVTDGSGLVHWGSVSSGGGGGDYVNLTESGTWLFALADLNVADDLNVEDNATVEGNLTVDGEIFMGEYLVVTTDTDQNTTYTAGTNLQLVGTEFSVTDNVSLLGDMTIDGVLSVNSDVIVGGFLAAEGAMEVKGAFTGDSGLFSLGLSAATLNTGQGANELYDMDQNVQTTDDVTFNNLSVSDSISAIGTITGSNLSGTNTGDQDLSSYLTKDGASDIYVELAGDTMTDKLNIESGTFNHFLSLNRDSYVPMSFSPSTDFQSKYDGEALRLIFDGSTPFAVMATGDISSAGGGFFADDVTVDADVAVSDSVKIGDVVGSATLEMKNAAENNYLMQMEYADQTLAGGFYEHSADGMKLVIKDNAGAAKVQIAPSGNSYINSGKSFSVSTTDPLCSDGGMDISEGTKGLIVGADTGETTRTDETLKYGRMGCPHYLIEEQPVALFLAGSGDGYNQLNIGGGTAWLNAMTQTRFFLAEDTTTTTGSARAVLDYDEFNLSPNVNLVLDGDASKLYFGAGQDASIYFDGTNQKFDLSSGDFVFDGGSIFLNNNEKITFKDSGGTYRTIFQYTSANDAQLTNSQGDIKLLPTGGDSVKIQLDDAPLKQGAGDDYSQYYDGTNQQFSLTSGGFFFNKPILATDGTSTTRITNSGGYGYFGTSSNHPFRIQTNGTTKYEIGTDGDLHQIADSQNIFLGASDDASITYDGTNLLINPQEVGSGVTKFTGSIYADTTTKINADGLFNEKSAEDAFGIYGGSNAANGAYFITSGKDRTNNKGALVMYANTSEAWAGSNDHTIRFGQYDGSSWTNSLVIDKDSNVKIPADSKKLYLGAGDDASINFDGSIMNINVDSGYTGRLKVAGATQMIWGATGIQMIDDKKAWFGTGSDASIYYDGTDLIIDSAEVGSGKTIFPQDVSINGTLYCDSFSPAISGGGTPGGSDTQVQFNDGGSFGGIAELTYSGSTVYYNGVEIGAGGESESPVPYLVSDNTGGQSITTSTITVNLDNELYPDANYTLNTDTIEIGSDGTYWVSYTLTTDETDVTGDSRCSYAGWIENNGIEIQGSRTRQYYREQNSGSSLTKSFPVDLTTSSVLRLRCVRLYTAQPAFETEGGNETTVSIFKLLDSGGGGSSVWTDATPSVLDRDASISGNLTTESLVIDAIDVAGLTVNSQAVAAGALFNSVSPTRLGSTTPRTQVGLRVSGRPIFAGDEISRLAFQANNDLSVSTTTYCEMRVYADDPVDGSEDGRIDIRNQVGGSGSVRLGISDTISLPNDNEKLTFGAGGDASIYYDGTDLNINPKEVGVGGTIIDGDLTVSGDVYIAGDMQDYAYLTMSTNQTTGITAGDEVKLDGAVTNLNYNTSTHVITLKANKKYYLEGSARGYFSTSNAYVNYQWYDRTNSVWLGEDGSILPLTYGTNYSSVPTARAFVITTEAIEVELRIKAVSNLTYLQAGKTSSMIHEIK